MTTGNGKRKFGLFVLDSKLPKQIWEGDAISLSDKDNDKVQIFRETERSLYGTLIAIVSLDKGQNVSEITE
jgi:hypothetical protein